MNNEILEQLRHRLSQLKQELIPAQAKVQTILAEMFKIEYRISNLTVKRQSYKSEPFGHPLGMPKNLSNVKLPKNLDIEKLRLELEELEI